MTSDATYHAHWQQSQELHDRGAYTVGATGRAGSATDAPTVPANGREGHARPTFEPWHPRDLSDELMRVRHFAGQLAAIDDARPRDPSAADLDHLLAALSIEKSKTIPEIRDLYGLTEGEAP